MHQTIDFGYNLCFEKFNTDNILYRIPVNPDIISDTQGNANGDFNVLKIGQIVQPRTPELRKISFSSYFPGKPNNMTITVDDFKAPETYINFFRNAMMEKEILIFTRIQLNETGKSYFNDPGIKVIVSQFDYEERAGETEDFYYNIELTEYRDFSPLKMQVQKQGGKGKPLKATTEQTRSIPKGQIVVGKKMKINGKYYYDSFGAKPTGNGNGKIVVVGRILTTDTTRTYPILLKSESGGVLGWCKKSDLQEV